MGKVFTSFVERDRETGLYVASVPGLPGAHTQAASLDELRENLSEVISLVLEEMAGKGQDLEPVEFVGIQQVEVA